MKKVLFFILLIISVSFICAQQISIPRIDQMTNLPTPYLVRDWKQVAIDYDNFVFDTSRAGTYLPITTISTSNGVNYPAIKDIQMDTYVGQADHGNVAEAINILPAIVGASLVGVDKTIQLNVNWVAKIKDFFNLKNGEDVYLNSYSTTTGNDWWYEVMPNVFFYQLYSLYPNVDADFKTQFTTIADRELNVLYQLGGTVQPWNAPSMNYRAFDLLTGLPNATSVPEPEAAGSISWLMYQAYLQTDNPKYLQGAELALDFLQNWTTNPSYEIQLPYGIATAARMNALEGTNYDIQKMMNWTFSSGLNTLRGWGCIIGNWNGYDVSGLIGEANDAGNDYAFSMNGFQHAAALAPVAKYNKRYARAIGKWLLHLANSSRLFYTNALPQANQEPASYAWSTQYDTKACIPFESMKQNWNGTQPFAMGDAVDNGWAATDLSLYSGSSVGYLGAIIAKTNVEGILQIDLNKTDFRCDNAYPFYLYYNPTTTSQSVQLNLLSGNYDVYDAITETVIDTNASGVINFTIPADSVRELVVYPTGKTMVLKGRLKLVDGHVIDYHANYNFTNSLRIKAFSVSDTIVQITDTINAYCLPENNVKPNPTYEWFQNNTKIATDTTGLFAWKAPINQGVYQLKCMVSENGDTVSSFPISVTVVTKLSIAPIISDILFSTKMPFNVNSTITASANLNTSDVQYSWRCSSGTLSNAQTPTLIWHLPNLPGIDSIFVTVSNTAGTSSFVKPVLVKDFSFVSEPIPLIYYPFNGDTKNYAQQAFNAISVNAVLTTGANGIENSAYQFPSSNDYIYTPNDPALNFQDKISICFWVKPDALPSTEQYIISHGSYEYRYKISIIPEKKIRWTVKTNNGVIDLDADTVLQVGKYDYFTVMYTGYSMELYRNGQLSSFIPQTGKIQTTSESFTIARPDETTNDYTFTGAVDEIRIYDAELPQQLIKLLPSTFTLTTGIIDTSSTPFRIYPNPFTNEFEINLPTDEKVSKIQVYNLFGNLVYMTTKSATIIQLNISNGFYLLKLTTDTGKVYEAKIIKKE
jgi:hypothetical protein